MVTRPLRISYPSAMNGDGVIEGVIESREGFESIHGSTLWKTDPQQFAKITKIDPLDKELAERQTRMWITGRRRSSGGERADMDVLEFESMESTVPIRGHVRDRQPFDPRRGRWKLNPLAYWTYEQVWNYIRKHNLPYNVLYDQGYTSLGDVMTTSRPIRDRRAGDAIDSFERSGRFVGLHRTECGLHSRREKIKEQKEQALRTGEEFTAPILVCDKCIDSNVDNFENKVMNGEEGHNELLVEFYSPYCEGCQAFAPTLNRLANQLALSAPNIAVVRFDVTESEIPSIGGKPMFTVESTPTLYRVRYAPSFHVELYERKHDFDSILQWVTGTRES